MTTKSTTRPRSARTFPPYSGKLSKVTGEGEQVEIAFTADSAEELSLRLDAVGTAASVRLKSNNDAIVRAGATFEERQRQAYDAAVTTLRQEMTTMLQARREEHEPPEDEEPVGPPAPGDAPAEDEEPPTDADPSARALHAATDP